MPRFACIAVTAVFAVHCSSIEIKNQYAACEKITIGPGAEDFALFSSPAGTSIFVSSHERRGWKVPGDIYSFDVKSRQVSKTPRTGEPAGLVFAPHGIDIFRRGKDAFLYVVNHGAEMNDANHSILIYAIQPGNLVFLTQIRHGLIYSPNDLSVTEDGSFYVTNDHGSRGSLWEVFWGFKKSTIIYCALISLTANSKATCQVATEGLAMANGILVRDKKVYISATREGRVYAFARNADNTLSDKTEIAEVAGPDNLFSDGNNLLTASHTSNWKFFRHVSSAQNKAPSYIVRIEPASKTATGLYFDDGTEIGAASGAFIHANKLYISQVFEDFILECPLAK